MLTSVGTTRCWALKSFDCEILSDFLVVPACACLCRCCLNIAREGCQPTFFTGRGFIDSGWNFGGRGKMEGRLGLGRIGGRVGPTGKSCRPIGLIESDSSLATGGKFQRPVLSDISASAPIGDSRAVLSWSESLK